ncbi:hypothetical protein [Vibrio phage vB_pir03]|nr:hypothetical protein [Vibrio phage vB_pir03]
MRELLIRSNYYFVLETEINTSSSNGGMRNSENVTILQNRRSEVPKSIERYGMSSETIESLTLVAT